jgi:non-ribosomal peptide synthetase component F
MDRVLMKTSICFDVSMFEIFWPLICGGVLVIAKQGGQLDPECITYLIVIDFYKKFLLTT